MRPIISNIGADVFPGGAGPGGISREIETARVTGSIIHLTTADCHGRIIPRDRAEETIRRPFKMGM